MITILTMLSGVAWFCAGLLIFQDDGDFFGVFHDLPFGTAVLLMLFWPLTLVFALGVRAGKNAQKRKQDGRDF